MKLMLNTMLAICVVAVAAQAQISSFKHVVVIVQENRTPDNLFQGLCSPPFGSTASCSTTDPSKYNIQTSDWLDNTSLTHVTQPKGVALANKYDLSHAHSAFTAMCDSTGGPGFPYCRMDGAAGIQCGGKCPSQPQFRFVTNTNGILNPYLELATQYGWANFMFQTNQGPSFPAHQFLFGGTSAPTAEDDPKGIFAAENMSSTIKLAPGTGLVAGCTAESTTRVKLIRPPDDESQSVYPCFEHQTMADLLTDTPTPVPLTWRYYTPGPGSIWTAPNAIAHICKSTGPGGTCTGDQWNDNVDAPGVPSPAPNLPNNGSVDILRDIKGCNLRSVSWVIPTGQNSDHAKSNDGGGPSWVASIVNAIGSDTQCDGGTGYWKDTAILITWDDWGGWYDHEPPTILNGPGGDYQYGFRVPLLVVSAYTAKGLINSHRHDFGSILKFIEHNFGLPLGGLNFADARSENFLPLFFDLTQPARQFTPISAAKTAAFFLKDKRKPTDPDDDQ
jgi:phospholipase C